MKKIMGVGLIFVAVVLVIPSLLVLGFSEEEPGFSSNHQGNEKAEKAMIQMLEEEETIAVYRTATSTVEEVPLEDYIVGVVAAEMPAEFELEALKAQALTARTYIINFMSLALDNDMRVPAGADIKDTVEHQVYYNDEELRERWENYDWKIARIKQAVYETSGQIITHNGSPITATFFSTSNGYTENSEEYWSDEIAYLRGVESPWDVHSPRYEDEVHMTVAEFEEKLGVSIGEGSPAEIVSRSSGGRVAEVNIGGKTFTGREVREEYLDLRSSDFTIERNGDTIIIKTTGYGHGVGMSQYGANGMAQEGYSYEDIIHHYYHSVEIEDAGKVLGSISAQKNRNENS
ncbi:stage II sporulation protein D [Evansella cellulosilytica]|uniref:Stage II sporulation protein D n=1 Tax=Evansella cellulosilytica (strain ATCC 21833 / DSM 2522 / FERM P-1141 / JCM 9156 / N-4) TaxID=649639 RepID=E6TX86_EVAC2|nr:stage II sporulation protein D [Evansella cellulosilytica]ADU32281.1 stage II sporulation protein D [Evansella cellulosilytica DSM 2522]